MIFKNFFVYPKYPENLTKLYKLACNLWAVWDYDAIALFFRIDTVLFRQISHCPLKFLHSLSKEKLAKLFKVELFYIYDEEQRYKIMPMELSQTKGSTGHYKYTLKVEGYGSQSMNARLLSANAIVQDIHPELIKWKS